MCRVFIYQEFTGLSQQKHEFDNTVVITIHRRFDWQVSTFFLFLVLQNELRSLKKVMSEKPLLE